LSTPLQVAVMAETPEQNPGGMVTEPPLSAGEKRSELGIPSTPQVTAKQWLRSPLMSCSLVSSLTQDPEYSISKVHILDIQGQGIVDSQTR